MVKLISALAVALIVIKRIWEEWNIIGTLLFSLMLQTFLTLVAPFRKSTRNKRLLVTIWCAYLVADPAANFAIGLISNNQRKPHGSSATRKAEEEAHLLAFWAPFLLLHLGCPDPITAFSLEDNELWRRHMLSLILQAVAAIYVFVQSLSHNDLQLQVATVLMFIAGVIKYSERIWALYQASSDRFRSSMLQDPDPGPDYALLMKKHDSMKKANFPVEIKFVEEPEREARNEKEGKLSDLEVVHYAYNFFKTFKGLVVDLVFSTSARQESRAFFMARESKDALRVLEVELNFIYGVFYTKLMIMHTRASYIFRTIALGSILAALGFFHFGAEKSEFDPFSVTITYILLSGAITMEVIAILMLTFSDWSFAFFDDWNRVHFALKPVTAIFRFLLFLKDPIWYEVPRNPEPVDQQKVTPDQVWGTRMFRRRSRSVSRDQPRDEVLGTRMFRRWSGSVPGHNFMGYCLGSSPPTIHEFPSWRNQIPGVEAVRHLVDSVRCLVRGMLMLPPRMLIEVIRRKIPKRVSDKISWEDVTRTFCYIPTTVARKTGLQDYLDEMAYVSQEPLTKNLWDLVYNELKTKSTFAADNQEIAKQICSSRGEWVLRISNDYDNTELEKFVSDEVEYDQRILLWHIATDLCYYQDTHPRKPTEETIIITTKLLSDYMLYLLVMQPSMMSTVVGLTKIRFQDTLAEARRLFDGRYSYYPRQGKERTACTDILKLNTDVAPVCLKGDRSKSVLFDACRLAKELCKLGDDKWELMSKVWVELLSYAATHCRPSAHVEQIGKGGELITFVWLLVAHFGFGHYFQSNKIAKLIQGK